VDSLFNVNRDACVIVSNPLASDARSEDTTAYAFDADFDLIAWNQ
jgi:hypothetical protein